MPHLVGIHNPGRAAERLQDELARMIRAVDLPGFRFVTRRGHAPGLAVGNVLPGLEPNRSQPAIDPATGVWAMLDGELFNVDELRPRLAQARGVPVATLADLDDAGLALGLYLELGTSFVHGLSGMWNLVISDPRTRSALLISDRAGSRLLYLAEDGERLTFGSEAKGVIAGRLVASRAGGVGLLSLLSGGSPIGDSTWIDGVRVLEPGTILHLEPSRRRTQRWFKLRFREAGPTRSEDDYASGFQHHLRTAVERTMRLHPSPTVGITLSGGLDSRSIALSIDRRHLPLPSLTFGDAESADVRFARQLAELCGFTHHWVEDQRDTLERASRQVLAERFGDTPHPSGFYGCQLHRILWRAEAMSPFIGFASMVWHPLYARLMRIVLNGACGDAMTGSHLTPELLLGPPRAQVMARLEARVFAQPDTLLRPVFAPAYWARFRPERAASFADTFRDIDGDHALAVSNVWDMENRQRRGTFTSFCVERYFATVRAPYLDSALVDFLADLPPRYRFQQRVYKRMIVRGYPDARHVPWAYNEGPITDRPAYEFAREALNFVRNRVERRLGLAPAQPRWAFRDTEKLFRDDVEIARGVARWARSERLDPQVFDRDGIVALVEAFEAGRAPPGASTLLGHLVGLAAWSEWAADGSVVPVPIEADPSKFDVFPWENGLP